MGGERKPAAPKPGWHSGASPSGGSGGRAAGPSRTLPHFQPLADAPTGAADSLPPVVTLRLLQATAVLGALGQAAVTLSQWQAARSNAGRAQSALLTLAAAALAVCAIRAPAFIWRWRLLLLTAGRVALYCVPSVRHVGVGSAILLERPARPGWRGAAVDLAHILLGTRLGVTSVIGIVVPLPPARTLATQAVQVALSANSPAYCGTQLMRQRLTQWRARQLAGWLEAGALPVLALMAAANPPEAGVTAGRRAPSTAVCRATLLFLQLSLGVLLPTLVSAYGWRQVATGDAATRAGGHPAAPGPTSAQHAGGTAAAAAKAWGGWGRAVERSRRLAAAADRRLARALQAAGGRASRAALAWFLLALCWAVCKQQAGLPLLL